HRLIIYLLCKHDDTIVRTEFPPRFAPRIQLYFMPGDSHRVVDAHAYDHLHHALGGELQIDKAARLQQLDVTARGLDTDLDAPGAQEFLVNAFQHRLLRDLAQLHADDLGADDNFPRRGASDQVAVRRIVYLGNDVDAGAVGIRRYDVAQQQQQHD